MDEKTGKASEIIGISEAKAAEIQKEIRHARIDAKNISDLAKRIKVAGSGEMGFRAYCFGRIVAENQRIGKEK